MQNKPKPFVHRAAYYETDKMGIVHHANYIRWFEDARMDYMRQYGVDYAEMEKHGILMPVTDISCEYKTPVRFNEEVQIDVKMLSFNGVRLRFSYSIYSLHDHHLVAFGESGHCFVHSDTMHPMSLQKNYPDWYEKACSILHAEEAIS